MNITFVSDAIYPYNKGGKEKRLYELSTRLSRLGHDVHIYTMHWWKTPEKSRTENGVTLHAISPLYSMYNGETRSIKEGVLFSLHCLKLFRVQFEILDVDHMPFLPIYSAWLVCLLRRRKLYGSWHEALSRKDWTNYVGKLGYLLYVIQYFSIKMPYVITSSSAHTKEVLQNTFGRTKRLFLVTPGIDTQLINALPPAPIQCDVLYTGRLVKDKNVDKLIEAIAILQTKRPKIQCKIVGHGIEKARLKKLIVKLGLQKNVSLLEPLAKDTDVYAYMKASKVFCLPSIREGFGMVVLESIGCGTPVVTIDTPSNNSRHLIDPGKTGSLCSVEPKELAAALDGWLKKPKPRYIARGVSHYDWDALAKKQYEVYAA